MIKIITKYFAIMILFSINTYNTYGQTPANQSTTNTAPIVSQQIPLLNNDMDDISEELKNTVWVTIDMPNNRELYAFFFGGKYGNIAVDRGEPVTFPNFFYPKKFVQKGAHPFSSIFIIPSQEKVLYYTFYLLDPYHLIISAGYDTIEPLLEMDTKEYLADGFLLQLVY